MSHRFESCLAKAMLDEIINNDEIKAVLIHLAHALRNQVFLPLKDREWHRDWSTLTASEQAENADVQECFKRYARQHSSGDASIGALLPNMEQSELETPEGRRYLLNAIEPYLGNPEVYLNTVENIIQFMKVIDNMAFAHFTGAYNKGQYSENHEMIINMIVPTKEEHRVKTTRVPSHLAQTYGIETSEQDLVLASSGIKGVPSGKANFVFFPPEKREYKLSTTFEKQGATSAGLVPFVAGPSFSTSGVLCMVQELGLFEKDGVWDLDKAQIFANCLMGYYVYCGHHSVYEVHVPYNNMLDYNAWRAREGEVRLPIADLFASSELGSVERQLPYYKVGKIEADYRSSLHASYADRVVHTARDYDAGNTIDFRIYPNASPR